MRVRRLVGVCGRALVVLAVPLAAIEVGLRLFAERVPPLKVLLHDPSAAGRPGGAKSLEELLAGSVIGFRPCTRRFDFVLNSRSLLTHEYATEKAPGTYRVLAMGDSFTFASNGVGYRNIWHARLRDGLEGRLGRPVEMLNLGVPATGPEFQLRMWELEGARLGADLVILTLVVGSNFEHVGEEEQTFSDRLAHASRAYRIARNVLRLSRSRPEGWTPPPADTRRKQQRCGVPWAELHPEYVHAYDTDRPHLSKERYRTIQRRYLRVCKGQRMEERFLAAGDTLRRLAEQVVASGAEFVVCIAPARIQYDVEHRRAVLGARAPRTDNVLNAPQRFLAPFLADEGIRHLDLLPHFARHPRDVPLYRRFDTHWNVEGNALAAEVLLDLLAP